MKEDVTERSRKNYVHMENYHRTQLGNNRHVSEVKFQQTEGHFLSLATLVMNWKQMILMLDLIRPP